MATRTIVTSQPDVACYVCERRLLRGELPEVFLADGHPRTVCELCAPRAAHEGWLREADSEAVSLPPVRPRRGRNLFGRLRLMGRPATDSPDRSAPSPAYDDPTDSYDFLGGARTLDAGSVAVPLADRAGADRAGASLTPDGEPEPAHARPAAAYAAEVDGHLAGSPLGIRPVDEAVERAIEIFNAGEYPRRVAGVARSLGVPGVSVHAAEDGGNAVVIVVAWELCWYRYVVDFDEQPVEARCLAQGTELVELAEQDRVANAVVDDAGALSLGASP